MEKWTSIINKYIQSVLYRMIKNKWREDKLVIKLGILWDGNRGKKSYKGWKKYIEGADKMEKDMYWRKF